MFLLPHRLGIRKLDSELVAIAIIYLVQGALGLSHLAVSFFFKDELGLSPAETASLLGLVMIPWTIKPIYGFISDSLPIFGDRRRPYLVLFGGVGALAWLGMATIAHSTTVALVLICIASLSLSFTDAIIDAIIVERARLEPEGDAGSLQSFAWGAVAIGAVVSAFLSGYLVEHFGTYVVFTITAVLPLISASAALALRDDRLQEDLQIFAVQWQPLKQAFTNPRIVLPAAFIFLWQATPSADAAFFFFTTNDLKFNPQFLGTVRLVTSLAGLAGIWLFHRFLRLVSIQRIFLWTTIISALLGMTSLVLVTHANRSFGIDDRWFSLGDSLVLTVAGKIAYMPVLVLAARLCPLGVEATFFAVLMSVLNLGYLCSQQLGAGLTYILGVVETNFDNLWLLVLITNLSTLLPLLLLRWLPPETPTKSDEGVANLEQSLVGKV